MKNILLLAFALLVIVPAYAQPDTLQSSKSHHFSVRGELWTRGEIRAGALPAQNGEEKAYFLSGSTLLGLDYLHNGFQVRIAPKHSGVWGAQNGGDLSLDEGWISLTHRSGLFLKVGRQKIAYDDERIIGTNDWVMNPSRPDLIKAGIDREKHKLHVLFAFNQNADNVNGGSYYKDGGQPYKSMQTVWYHTDPLPQLGVSLLFMNTGMQNPLDSLNDTQYQQLFGAFVEGRPGPVDIQASYYRQTGHCEYALPIHAWMTSIEAAWQMTSRFRVNTGYFHMSGDEKFYVPPEGALGMTLKTEVRGFNPIFGSHHQFYGAMDFFYVTTYYGGNTPGLQDFHVGVKWDPSKTVSLLASYHYLATAIQVPETTKTLGHELELSASWTLLKDVTLQAGYSFMDGTETMAVLKRSHNRNHLNWGWIMLSVTPEFFSYSW